MLCGRGCSFVDSGSAVASVSKEIVALGRAEPIPVAQAFRGKECSVSRGWHCVVWFHPRSKKGVVDHGEIDT